jgi:hypothetical protein
MRENPKIGEEEVLSVHFTWMRVRANRGLLRRAKDACRRA